MVVSYKIGLVVVTTICPREIRAKMQWKIFSRYVAVLSEVLIVEIESTPTLPP